MDKGSIIRYVPTWAEHRKKKGLPVTRDDIWDKVCQLSPDAYQAERQSVFASVLHAIDKTTPVAPKECTY